MNGMTRIVVLCRATVVFAQAAQAQWRGEGERRGYQVRPHMPPHRYWREAHRYDRYERRPDLY